MRWVHGPLGLAGLCAFATCLGLGGCEDSKFEEGVRGTVKERLEQRGKEGEKAVAALFTARDEKISASLAELGLASIEWDPEQKHPLVAWREGLNEDTTTADALREHAPKYPGTPMERRIPRYQTYFESNNRYWSNPELASLDEYWGFLQGYLEANPGGPFADDVLFDQVFVHARRQFELFKVKPENRVTSVFRYWQLAFDFPSLPGEAFMPYIARLCEKDDEFKAFCRKIPFEFRHLAIMTPYYDALIAKLDTLLERHPDSPFRPAADYLKARFVEDQKKMAKEFEEYPMLPESMAFLPANQRLNLVVGPRGVFFGDRPIEPSEDESFKLTEQRAKQLEEVIVRTLVEIREAGEPELRQGNIGILADRETPTGAVLRLAWSPMLVPEDQQSQLNLATFLIGRRRFDFSNLKVANELQLVPKAGTLSLDFSYSGGAAKCPMMGFTGERAIEMPLPTSFVHVTAKGKVVAGTLAVPAPEGSEEEGTPTRVALEYDASNINWHELSQWASDQRGAITFAAAPSVPWDTTLRAFGPLAFRCKDDKCEKSEPRAQPNIYVGFCE